MNPADAQRLQETYRREFRSLLQYAREASPYAAVADRALLTAVLRIAAEESTALAALGQLLEQNRITLPYLGSYPMPFADLNFVAIRHLLGKLVVAQQRDLVKLESEHAAATDTLARDALQQLIEVHRRHLKELESLG